MPFSSKTKGRMSHLLKSKSKLSIKQKPRVKYEPFVFNKRRRDPLVEEKRSDSSQSVNSNQTNKKKIIPQIISTDAEMADGGPQKKK